MSCRYEVDKTTSFVWGEWHVLKCFTKALALVNRCVPTIKNTIFIRHSCVFNLVSVLWGYGSWLFYVWRWWFLCKRGSDQCWYIKHTSRFSNEGGSVVCRLFGFKRWKMEITTWRSCVFLGGCNVLIFLAYRSCCGWIMAIFLSWSCSNLRKRITPQTPAWWSWRLFCASEKGDSFTKSACFDLLAFLASSTPHA